MHFYIAPEAELSDDPAHYIARDLLPSCPRARWNVLCDVIRVAEHLAFPAYHHRANMNEPVTLFNCTCAKVPSRCKVRENWLFMHDFLASFFADGGETRLDNMSADEVWDRFTAILNIARPMRDDAKAKMRMAAPSQLMAAE